MTQPENTWANQESFLEPGEIQPPAIREGLLPLAEGNIAEIEKISLLKKIGGIAIAAKENIHSIAIAASEDIHNSKNRLQTRAIGLGIVAIQALSRLQASWVFVPEVAVNVFKDTHSPLEAALAGGLAFGGWCLATGAATAEGLSRYPRAVVEFSRNFPGLVDFFKDSLPGLKAKETDNNNSRIKNIGSSALTRVKRGLTVTGFGSAIYAGTASINGMERNEVHKLNANASFDGGLVTGSIIYGLGEVIVKIAEHDPKLAEHIQNTASNIKLWYGVAAFMMVEQLIENRGKAWLSKLKSVFNRERQQTEINE